MDIGTTAAPASVMPSADREREDLGDITARMLAAARAAAVNDPPFSEDTARRIAVLLGAVHAGAGPRTAQHEETTRDTAA